MIEQDTLENQVKFIYLGIGSNLGNKKQNIEKAKSIIAQNNIDILQSSAYYETLSWPNANHPKFYASSYKLGKIYFELGDLDRAKSLIETASGSSGAEGVNARSFLYENF